MKLIFTICYFLFVITLSAQTVISGKVSDENGTAIPGANVFLEDTYDGTTTGTDGKFQFSTDEGGKKMLVIKFIGYKEFNREVTLNGSPIVIDVTLEEAINQLEAVTITAGSFTASDESRRTIFKAVDIASTAGATADIAGALNTLPGTQKVGESGRLFVRGGDGNETRTFIDGMLVMNAYSASAPNTPSRGRFLPFMFKGTSFSTGGYSSEYGQALSSTLVLDSKDKPEATRTDFAILSVGADVTHTQSWDRGSLAGKIQYTNIRPYFHLINQEIDWITPPASIEGHAAFRHEVGKQGMFKAYGNFNHSDFSLYHHDIDDLAVKSSYDLTNDYRYLNTAYENPIGKNWIVRGGMSYTFSRNDIMQEADQFVETEKGLHAKAVVEGSVSDQIELKTGVEVINRDYGLDIAQEGFNSVDGFHEVITAGFVEGDIYASNKFVTRAGMRLEHNSLLNKVSADPRISLAYQTGDASSLSLAYGKFRQSPANALLREDHRLQQEKAEHYIMSYQVLENNRTFRAEVYYKRYSDLVKFNADRTVFNNDGYGYARGIEVFWRDNTSFKNTDYWISYSYLDSKRDYLNFPYEAVPSFVSAHNFSVVYKYFFTKLKTQLGATYSFASGRPYNNPNDERFNGSETPTYQDLSFNFAYLPKPNLIIYFSATNLFGRDNIFGYQFSDNLNEDGFYNSRPIRQPAKRFLFIGIFITLSKDKSINQLPSL